MSDKYNRKSLAFIAVFLIFFYASEAFSQSLSELIKKIKPSIVGVGTYQATRRPPSRLSGTGFVVADGYHIITNYHVLPSSLNSKKNEKLTIFYNQNNKVHYRSVKIVDIDKAHDLALLKLSGKSFPRLSISQSDRQHEGEDIFFTGFPIGAVLGLYPVTHRGIISSISPIGIPVPSSSQLTSKMINRLKNRYNIFQLDATAYPGNSGSPVFSLAGSDVIGVINKVFIKESKESVIQKPSGITYAIPGKYVRLFLQKNHLSNNQFEND